MSLVYDYDENGVILKRQQDMNGTMVDLGENLFIPADNLTEFLNLNHNESVQIKDILSLQDLLQGKSLRTLPLYEIKGNSMLCKFTKQT